MDALRNFYIMRANNNSEKLFVQKNIVAIGWSDINYTDFKNVEDFIIEIENRYGEEYNASAVKRQQWGRYKTVIRRFSKMKYGDVIVVPYENDKVVFAMITGIHKYDAEENRSETDIANQIEVTYLKNKSKIFCFEKNNLSAKFVNRINRQGLIIDEVHASEVAEILNILTDIAFENSTI